MNWIKLESQEEARKRERIVAIHPDSNGWKKWVYSLPTRQMAAIYKDYDRKGVFTEKKTKKKFRQMDIFEAARNMEREAQMEGQKLLSSMQFIVDVDIGSKNTDSYIQVDEMIDGKRCCVGSWSGKEADQLYLDLVDRIIEEKKEAE